MEIFTHKPQKENTMQVIVESLNLLWNMQPKTQEQVEQVCVWK